MVEGTDGGSRGEKLAAQLMDANAAFIALVESLTPAQWEATGANAPGYRFDSNRDESRTIAQIANHTARQHLTQIEIVRGVALGAPPLPGPRSSPESNAIEAAETPTPDRAEVVRLLRENGAAAAAVLRSLTDEQLETGMTFKGWTMTAEQLAVQNQVGHVLWHTASIREALASSSPR